MQLQPGDQYCASCGTKVLEPHSLDRKYLIAIGIGFLIIGILAGAYASKYLQDGQTQDKNDSQTLDESQRQILDSTEFKLKGDKALGVNNTESLYYYKKSTEIKNSIRGAWVALGSFYRKEQNYTNALECYSRAIGSTSSDLDPWEIMGDVYSEMAFKNKNLSDLEKANYYYDKMVQTPTSVLNKKSKNLINWTENVENDREKELELLWLALESSNMSIKINQSYADSWEIRSALYRRLHYIINNSKYDDEADKCYRKMAELRNVNK